MNGKTFSILMAGLLLLHPALADARQQDQEYQKAYAELNKALASDSPAVRAAAIRALGVATTEKHDKTTASAILSTLANELNQKKEERIANDVLAACVETLQKIRDQKTIDALAKQLTQKGQPWRTRFYLVHGLATLPGTSVLDALLKLTEDKVLQLQVAALDALVARGDKSVLSHFIKILNGSFLWEIRISALAGIGKMGDESLAGDLIEIMRKARDDEGRLINEIAGILKGWIGGDGGHDPNAWAAILAAKKQGTSESQTGVEIVPVNFFGIKSKSTRILYIIDVSGSMNEPASEPPARNDKEPPIKETGPDAKPDPNLNKAKEAKAVYDTRQVKTRLDAMKKELINSIYNLDTKVLFNIVYFSDQAHCWQPSLFAATWANKLEAMRFIDSVAAYGGTNTFDSLETAFKFVQVKDKPDLVQFDKDANYATGLAGVDTVYLLSDGVPVGGRISDRASICEEIKKVNKLRKMVINTIAVGDPNPNSRSGAVDPAFLERIANENNGSFVHIHR